MAKRNFGDEFGFQTRAVHTGNDVDSETGAIKRPITMANSYELPYDPSDLNWSSAGKNLYTRNGGSNQQYLQEKLASLEGGEDCVVLASGVAALSGLFFALLKSGDHVVFSSVTYIAVYRLLNELLKDKFGVETTIVDNTFASPFNQRPIELGADFTVESLTKYINGHGDAMGGAIIGKQEYLDIIRAQSQINLGATISPFNAWLIMRGSVTLPLRMKQHNENAIKVARYLKMVKGVSFVAYPGLEDHPNHDVAVKQMKNGFGGVLSFGLKADHDTYNRFVTHLKVITSAVSLGHDESLIVFLGENDERQYLYPEEFHNGFFRFSVGIEDAEDIIEDLRQAFEKENLL